MTLWQDKVALVTGASTGIGEAVARLGAREGGRVWLLDVDQRGEDVASAIRDDGGCAQFIRVDVMREADITAAVDTILAEEGRIDVLVNNAGRDAHYDATTMDAKEWDAVMHLDLRAPWLLARAVFPAMISARQGAIVNLGSLHARLTAEGHFPYGAAKAGLGGLTRTLALEVGRYGVRVNTVSPGYTLSTRVAADLAALGPRERERICNLHPLRRFADPEDIAEVVVFVASDRARAVTGADWAVDGGLGARYA